MPIDVDRALGAAIPASEERWDEDRVILYHLGIGAGVPATDPNELAYTYEANLKVLPSFVTIPAMSAMMGLLDVPGLDFNPVMLVHGDQEIRLDGPLPTSAAVTQQARIAEIWDKGKGAVVVVEVTGFAGERRLYTTRSGIFLRGEGGFGGDPGPAAGNGPPDRAADLEVVSPTLEQQALLYRLSGDKNPLHADPAFAAMAGFPRPILHGLCTYGIVAKAVVDTIADGDVAAVASYRARFTKPVFPGQAVTTSMWRTDDGMVLQASTDDGIVLSNAAVTLR